MWFLMLYQNIFPNIEPFHKKEKIWNAANPDTLRSDATQFFANLIPNPHFVSVLGTQYIGLKIRALHGENSEIGLYMK